MKPYELQTGRLYQLRGSEDLLEFRSRQPPRHPSTGKNHFKIVNSSQDNASKMLRDAEVSRKVTIFEEVG